MLACYSDHVLVCYSDHVLPVTVIMYRPVTVILYQPVKIIMFQPATVIMYQPVKIIIYQPVIVIMFQIAQAVTIIDVCVAILAKVRSYKQYHSGYFFTINDLDMRPCKEVAEQTNYLPVTQELKKYISMSIIYLFQVSVKGPFMCTCNIFL